MILFECGLKSCTHTHTKYDTEPRCTKIKQRINHGAIYLLINRCAAQIKVKMTISVHGSLAVLWLIHTKLLEYVTCILCLAYECPIFNLLDLKSKKKCEFTHHGHFKPICHNLAKFIIKRFISRTKDNVINIYLAYK
jgi:hypothetical protein